MKLAECSVAGFVHLPNKDKRCFKKHLLSFIERLREEPRSGTVVVVRLVDLVRVELHLVVVEVEVGSVRELAIAIGIIVFVHPGHQNLKSDSCWQQDTISLLNLI
jgi:hypothetical protein